MFDGYLYFLVIWIGKTSSSSVRLSNRMFFKIYIFINIKQTSIKNAIFSYLDR